jgi:anti-sigma factor RsiW
MSQDCPVEELLSVYLDGELGPGELDLVVGHLAVHAECVATFHDLKAVRTAVRTLRELEVPERLLPESHHGEELSAYLDGALSTMEHESLTTHVATCSECRDELHELDAARTAVRALPVLEPPEFLDLRRRKQPPAPKRRRSAGLIAGAAAAIVAVAVVSGNGGTPHEVDVDMLADQHTARVSVEPGFSIVPAVAPIGSDLP